MFIEVEVAAAFDHLVTGVLKILTSLSASRPLRGVAQEICQRRIRDMTVFGCLTTNGSRSSLRRILYAFPAFVPDFCRTE